MLLIRLTDTDALHIKTRDKILREIVLFNVPLLQLIGNCGQRYQAKPMRMG